MKKSQEHFLLVELLMILVILILTLEYAEPPINGIELGINILLGVFLVLVVYLARTDLCSSEADFAKVYDYFCIFKYELDNIKDGLTEVRAKADDPPWIHDLPVAAFLHLRQWSEEEKIQILNSLGAESAEYCPQCGAKCRVNPAPSANKLFVWDSCEDYSIKKIIIYAPSVEKARKIALKQLDSGIFNTSGLSSEPTMYEGETFGYVDIRD